MHAFMTTVRTALRRRGSIERSLTNWRQQLESDRRSNAATVRLVSDYLQISALLRKLGRRQEAAEEFRQGMLLMELTFKGHPAMREFYSGYLALLDVKTNAEEVSRIKEKREALPRL